MTPRMEHCIEETLKEVATMHINATIEKEGEWKAQCRSNIILQRYPAELEEAIMIICDRTIDNIEYRIKQMEVQKEIDTREIELKELYAEKKFYEDMYLKHLGLNDHISDGYIPIIKFIAKEIKDVRASVR